MCNGLKDRKEEGNVKEGNERLGECAGSEVKEHRTQETRVVRTRHSGEMSDQEVRDEGRGRSGQRCQGRGQKRTVGRRRIGGSRGWNEDTWWRK